MTSPSNPIPIPEGTGTYVLDKHDATIVIVSLMLFQTRFDKNDSELEPMFDIIQSIIDRLS